MAGYGIESKVKTVAVFVESELAGNGGGTNRRGGACQSLYKLRNLSRRGELTGKG